MRICLIGSNIFKKAEPPLCLLFFLYAIKETRSQIMPVTAAPDAANNSGFGEKENRDCSLFFFRYCCATLHASPNISAEPTPFLCTSSRMIKIACSNTLWSDVFTTTIRLVMPFTIYSQRPPSQLHCTYSYSLRAKYNLYRLLKGLAVDLFPVF